MLLPHMACIACARRITARFSWSALLNAAALRSQQLLPVADWLCEQCLLMLQPLRVPHPSDTNASDRFPYASDRVRHAFDRVRHAHSTQSDQGNDPEHTTSRADNTRPLCERCSRELNEWDEQRRTAHHLEHRSAAICFDCQRWRQWEKRHSGEILVANVSAIRYNNWAQELIHRYKYKGDTRLRYFLASLIGATVTKHDSLRAAAAIIPIPLGPTRQAERGFNQSTLIAELLSEQWDIPLWTQVIQATDTTDHQSKKGRTARFLALTKKYIKHPHIHADIKGKRIILIDDVYTTGATVHAAAYLLKQNGAQAVVSCTVAR